ncbi:MAG: hypothetical protein ABR538_03390 [Candidatus Binatia bacterium]
MRSLLVPFATVLLLGVAGAAAAQPDNTCVFTIAMTAGTDVNNLDFEVDYKAAVGNVEGTATRPECTRAINGQAFVSFHDDDENSILTGAVIRLTKFSAPITLAGCRIFYDSNEPIPGEFIITVTNAGRDGEDDNVMPKPTMAVTTVECPGELPEVTTTTLPETTTTLPGGGGDCGVPLSGGVKPNASDALFALKAAVGVGECELCVCDVNSSGSVAAGDALAILRAAVGSEAVLDCPPC